MATPPPESIMRQFLPLLGLMQQKQAQQQTDATNQQRNKILALQAANQQEQLRQQAEVNASNIARQTAELRAFNLQQEQDAEAREALRISFGSVGTGDTAFTDPNAVPDQFPAATSVALGNLPGLALLPPDEIEDAAGIAAKTRIPATEAGQLGLGQGQLDLSRTVAGQEFALKMQDAFPGATPENIRALLSPETFNAAFDAIGGDSKAKEAIGIELAKNLTAEFSIESANWRAQLESATRLRTVFAQSGSAVQVKAMDTQIELFKALSTNVANAAKALEIASKEGIGNNILPAAQALFAAQNAAELQANRLQGLQFAPFESGTTNPVFDFSGEQTDLPQPGSPFGESPQNAPPTFNALSPEIIGQAADGEPRLFEVQGPAPTSQVKSETATSRTATPQPLGLAVSNPPIAPSKRSTPEIGTPLLQPITTDGVSFEPALIQATNGTNVSPNIMRAIYQRESSNNPHAIGDNGKSHGLGQMQQAALIDTGLYAGRKVSSLNQDEQIIATTAHYGALLVELGSNERALVAWNLGKTKLNRLFAKHGEALSDIPAGVDAGYDAARGYAREILAMTLADGGPTLSGGPALSIAQDTFAQAAPPNTAAQSERNLARLGQGFPLSSGGVMGAGTPEPDRNQFTIEPQLRGFGDRINNAFRQ